MYEPQNFLDLQDGINAGGADPKSWLSAGGGGGGEDDYSTSSSPTLHRTLSSLSSAAASAAGGNVDQRLFNDLVEIVPLVQSLLTERKQTTSFTRRGSMIYTKTPSKESLYKKPTEAKGRNAAQSIPSKKQRDRGDNEQNNADSFGIFSSRSSLTEKDREELIALREQVEDLQRKLTEKDELLKSAEISKTQLSSVNAELDELKNKAAEKDSLLKSNQLQLSDAKIKLADKQAAVEKLEWETMTSNKKVEKLQQDLDRVEGEISTFILFIDGLKKDTTTTLAEDYDTAFYGWDHISDIDSLDESEMQRLEEARQAYATAVASVKEKQDEESIAAAARARSYLHSFVLRTNNTSAFSAHDGISKVAETLAN